MRGLQESSLDKTGLPHFRDAYTGSLQEHKNITWAQPLFSKDIIDGRIRRWRLIEAVCAEEKPAWYPSPQIVSLSLTSGMDWHAIEKEINAFLPDDCHTPVSKESVDALELIIGDHTVDLGAKGFHQRVIYSYSNKHKLGSAEIGYQRIPAHIITESDTQPSYEPVANKIVVIGASHQDSRDIHQTPVGSMPGALIVLNAVKSLKQFGQLDSIPLWTKILLETITITLMAYLFQRYNSLTAVFVIGVAIMVLLAPFSFYFFRYGVWVDLAAPILAMQFRFTVEDYVDAIKTRSELNKLKARMKENNQ
jgi:hypothetical protein